MEDNEENSEVVLEAPPHVSLLGYLYGEGCSQASVPEDPCRLPNGWATTLSYLLKHYSGCFHGSGLGMRLIFKWVDSEESRQYLLI